MPLNQPASTPHPQLRKALGLPELVLYGAGTILGAGIYVLVGKVAGESGYLSPLAFLLAALVVAFSAYSFAILSRRMPESAGPAAYVQHSFGVPWLSRLVGYSIVMAGVVSSATISRGFFGYFNYFFNLPEWLVVLGFVGVLTFVAMRGVATSVGLAIAITVVEILGLCLVVAAGHGNLHLVLENPERYFLPASLADGRGVIIGAFLAFYACIGFEDMVNMAEEVKNPRRDLPMGIAIVLVGTTLLYVLVTLTALTTVPLEQLAASEAPLALVIEATGFMPVGTIGLISIASVTNGALIQIIMGSRVLYGMANRGLAPAFLASIHDSTRIPHLATAGVGALVFLFALLLPLATLAKITSALILGVFLLVNLALLVVRFREHDHGLIKTGMPLVGAMICLLFILGQGMSL